MSRNRCFASLAADLVAVAVFVTIGRRSHAEGITASGVLATAWPFAAGVVVGWLLSRAWRAPAALRPSGMVVWLGAVVVAMALRQASGAGTAPSFAVVATAFLAVTLLGWRAVVAFVERR